MAMTREHAEAETPGQGLDRRLLPLDIRARPADRQARQAKQRGVQDDVEQAGSEGFERHQSPGSLLARKPMPPRLKILLCSI